MTEDPTKYLTDDEAEAPGVEESREEERRAEEVMSAEQKRRGVEECKG
jgi:hypothetical protein